MYNRHWLWISILDHVSVGASVQDVAAKGTNPVLNLKFASACKYHHSKVRHPERPGLLPWICSIDFLIVAFSISASSTRLCQTCYSRARMSGIDTRFVYEACLCDPLYKKKWSHIVTTTIVGSTRKLRNRVFFNTCALHAYISRDVALGRTRGYLELIAHMPMILHSFI
jgi:hypothetical protein